MKSKLTKKDKLTQHDNKSKKIDKMKNKLMRKDILSFLNLFTGRGY